MPSNTIIHVPSSSPPGPDGTLYEVLGVVRNATHPEIVKGYRRESKRWHPDRNPGDNDAKVMYDRVDVAYRVLSDPKRREEYDRTGRWSTAGTVSREGYVRKVVADMIINIVCKLAADSMDVTKEPMIGHLNATLDTHVSELKKALAEMKRSLIALTKAAGRFSVEGEENVLNAVLANHAKHLEAKVTSVEVEIELLGEAKEWVKRYRYKMDATDTMGWFTTSVTGWAIR